MAKQIRTITHQMFMRLLRHKQKIFNDTSLVMELKEDHSGCIKSGITLETIVVWNDLDELNELIKATYE